MEKEKCKKTDSEAVPGDVMNDIHIIMCKAILDILDKIKTTGKQNMAFSAASAVLVPRLANGYAALIRKGFVEMIGEEQTEDILRKAGQLLPDDDIEAQFDRFLKQVKK